MTDKSYVSFSIRALLAPFLQQGNGDADSSPEEDQHEDDKHFKKAEYYHFKQGKKKKNQCDSNQPPKQTSLQKSGLSFMTFSPNSDTLI